MMNSLHDASNLMQLYFQSNELVRAAAKINFVREMIKNELEQYIATVKSLKEKACEEFQAAQGQTHLITALRAEIVTLKRQLADAVEEATEEAVLRKVAKTAP